MTFPDPNLGRPLRPPEQLAPDADNVADVIPPTERNLDPARTEQSNALTSGAIEPMPQDRAAEPIAERVYAPASERVPKPPVPGHRDFIEHPDTHTPEREAAGMDSSEPSFTRVPRPTNGNGDANSVTTPYASPTTNPGLNPQPDYYMHNDDGGNRRQRMFMGLGAGWATVIAAGVGVWLFMRWRAERNKPMNRLRRQAQYALRRAEELRAYIPDRDEAARPAAGVGTALVPLAFLLWRASQSRSSKPEPVGRAERMGRKADKAARRAADKVSDVDWQHRLMQLKDRWNPSRIELEKIQISRH